jgi:adenylate kinase
MNHQPSTVLLLGPTGSGKTPLGDCLEQRGLRGRRCVHFDFGARLRAVGAGEPCAGLAGAELEVVRRSLQTGALLDDEHFPIARAILRSFVERHDLGPDDLLVLNGLPRHVGQAAALDGLVRVRLVVCLECSSATARARIRRDTGGDRAGRADDSPAEVRRKLRLFRERTIPLLDHYAGRKVEISSVRVGVGTTAEEIWNDITR